MILTSSLQFNGSCEEESSFNFPLNFIQNIRRVISKEVRRKIKSLFKPHHKKLVWETVAVHGCC